VDRGRQELGLDNLDLAVSCAESALEIAQSLRNEQVNNIIAKNARLFQQIFERRLGKLTRTITVSTRPSRNEKLSPEQAFLLSRLEGGLSVEEAIDLSPLSREQTLGQIVTLMRQGHIRLGA
jgi:DNA replication initiation complex subunit (GINS family)